MHQLAAAVFAEIEVKKSRFLGQLYPMTSRREAMAQIATIRAAHPGAVHVCWALLCAGDSGLDDDGEPSGTAAKPMYNVLTHKDLHNVLAVVVRYWGGCKLGAGGLTRAYGQAISEACKLATLIPIERRCALRLTCDFAQEASLRRLLESRAATLLHAEYGEAVLLDVELAEEAAADFLRAAHDLTRGSLRVLEPPE